MDASTTNDLEDWDAVADRLRAAARDQVTTRDVSDGYYEIKLTRPGSDGFGGAIQVRCFWD